MTAEFAAVVPAAVLVLAFCLAGAQIGAQQVRLQDAAADAARALARGDDASAAAARAGQVHADLASSVSGDLVCARLTAPAATAVPLASVLSVTAVSCALDGGR